MQRVIETLAENLPMDEITHIFDTQNNEELIDKIVEILNMSNISDVGGLAKNR